MTKIRRHALAQKPAGATSPVPLMTLGLFAYLSKVYAKYSYTTSRTPSEAAFGCSTRINCGLLGSSQRCASSLAHTRMGSWLVPTPRLVGIFADTTTLRPLARTALTPSP